MRKATSLTSFITGTFIRKGDVFDLYTLEDVCKLDPKNAETYKQQVFESEGFAKNTWGNSYSTQFGPVYKGECL